MSTTPAINEKSFETKSIPISSLNTIGLQYTLHLQNVFFYNLNFKVKADRYSSVYLTLAIHTKLRISQRIFAKIRNGPNLMLRYSGEKTWSRNSRVRLPLTFVDECKCAITTWRYSFFWPNIFSAPPFYKQSKSTYALLQICKVREINAKTKNITQQLFSMTK